MTAERKLRTPCAWTSKCSEPAIKERFHPWQGTHRPACALHCKSATPFELRPLGFTAERVS